jgi:hypothetical protein
VQAFRNSAPSSARLTGKPLLSGLSWLSYSSSGLCPERRVWSATRSRLSPGRELPTPAKLNEPLGSGPLGRDLHPLCVTATSPARRRSRHVAVAPAPEACGLGPQGACHRIECRDYSDGRRFCDTKAACVYMVRITPTSLRRARTSDSRRIRLYGSAPWRDGESLPSGLLVRQSFVGGAAHFGNVSEAFTSLTTSALPPTAPR